MQSRGAGGLGRAIVLLMNIGSSDREVVMFNSSGYRIYSMDGLLILVTNTYDLLMTIHEDRELGYRLCDFGRRVTNKSVPHLQQSLKGTTAPQIWRHDIDVGCAPASALGSIWVHEFVHSPPTKRISKGIWFPHSQFYVHPFCYRVHHQESLP